MKTLIDSFLGRCPRTILPIFIAVVLLGAAWVVTTPGRQTFQNADTVIFALTSTQAWTPFYWDQDRLGMLLPLLAMPIASPFLNLLFQDWLSLCATFLCFWGVAFCFVNARLSMMAGLTSAFILAALFPVETLFVFTGNSQYSVALLLGLAGIHCLFRRRQSGGALHLLTSIATSLACFTLAFWVNITMPIVILPLMLSTGIWTIFNHPENEHQSQDPRHVFRTAALGTVLLVAGFLINYLFVRKLNLPSTPTDILPPSMWFKAWRSAAALLWQKQGFVYTAILLTALTGARTCQRRRSQGLAVKTILPAVLILMIAFAYFLVIGLSAHVFYSSHYRYFIPAVILLIAGGLTCACMMLEGSRLTQKPLPISLALAASTMAAIFFRYGIPSIQESEHALDRRWGVAARAIIRHECTHIMGNYWHVWPTVFWTHHLLGKANATNQVHGITYRCGPSAKEWKDMPAERFRIAGIQPIANAYTGWGSPLPTIPEMKQTKTILKPDIHLYQATPKLATTPLVEW